MYTPRLVTPLPPLRFGSAALKMYGLSAFQSVPDAELIAAAHALTIQQVSALNQPDALGFVIVHQARPAQFVLIHVWQGVDLRQMYFTSPLDAPTELRPFAQGTVGCVWELGIIQHERDAWRDCMLSSDAGSPEQYLAALLSGEV